MCFRIRVNKKLKSMNKKVNAKQARETQRAKQEYGVGRMAAYAGLAMRVFCIRAEKRFVPQPCMQQRCV